MKRTSLVILIFISLFAEAQSVDSLIRNSSSILKNLKEGDSIIYYQCHVEEAIQQLSTVSGQTLTGNSQKYSITEKFVIKRVASVYKATYYSSSLTIFPNRKFSGLKIREKPYWNFKKEKEIILNDKSIKVILALEKKGKEAIEYDYAITKYNTNQLIIKLKRDFKQLVIEGDYVLSKLISN